MGLNPEQVRRLLRDECPNAMIERRGSGHFKVRLANGRSIIVSSTPSDRRFLLNLRADIRRAARRPML
jgi:hypothetical protein